MPHLGRLQLLPEGVLRGFEAYARMAKGVGTRYLYWLKTRMEEAHYSARYV